MTFRWHVLAGGIGAACLALGFVHPGQAGEATRPNIIYILADDLGYGDLGCYGQEQILTPRIDQMAAEGMRFTQHYAGSTVCAPSRCVLMTGKHLGHATIRGNARDPLRPEDETVAEVLHQAGYRTGLVGKWGLGEEGSVGVPTKQGFNSFFGYLSQHHAHNYYPRFLIRNEERVALRNVVPNSQRDGAGVATKKLDYSHDLIADEALQFIEECHENKRQPFFLYLALTIPHANNEAKNEGMEVPSVEPYADRDWPEPQKAMAAMVTRMDGDVGRILDLLKKLDIDDKTMVIFTSDNGPHREGGNNPDFFNSNGPLRGIKRDLYEGGIRVPMIARWPGTIAPGSESDHVSYFGDFFATAAELAGVKTPGDLDSISYLPTLLGRTDEQKEHDFLYWEFYEGGSKQAVRQGNWKAVRLPMFSGPIQLFNLKDDVGEEHDRAAEHPEIVAGMEQIMATAHTPSSLWKVSGPKKRKK